MTGGWSVAESLGKVELAAENRTAAAGGIGAFVACLFALELMLGSGPMSHMVRVLLLGGLMFSTVTLALVLSSDKGRTAEPHGMGTFAGLGSAVAYDLSYLGMGQGRPTPD